MMESNTNNINYINTNKDDINSLVNLEQKNNKINITENENDILNNLNNNNNYFNNNFSPFSPFSMANIYMSGSQNTFFDKLFLTLERANYQLYHLCEMIKLIKNQKTTIKFFKSLIISAFKSIKEKYYDIVNKLKEYFINLKNIFTFNNEKYNEEDLKYHIQIIENIIKFLVGFLLLIFTFYII